MAEKKRWLFHQITTIQLLCWFLLLVHVVNVNSTRRPRRKPTKKLHLTKKNYDDTIKRLINEQRYETFASKWMKFIVTLEENITSQIFSPQLNGGENLCNDLHRLNLELETILIPVKQQNREVAHIARKIFIRKGPMFLFELLPDNEKLKSVFNWDDYQLSRFYRIWMETRMIWEEFKENYLFMQAKCYHLHKL